MKKNGRTDSIEVKALIHAPLIPKDKSSKGPTQQADAPMAASIAPTSNQVTSLGGVSCFIVIKILLREPKIKFGIEV